MEGSRYTKTTYISGASSFQFGIHSLGSGKLHIRELLRRVTSLLVPNWQRLCLTLYLYGWWAFILLKNGLLSLSETRLVVLLFYLITETALADLY